MNVVIKDLRETKIKMERDNDLLLHQLGIKNKGNEDDKNALKRTAFKMLAEFNRQQNSSKNLKRKNDNEDDEVIDNEDDEVIETKKKCQIKKKSKIDKLLEEDVDDISVTYSNFTNETEYSQPQDFNDDIVEVSNVAKAASIGKNHRTSPRKQNVIKSKQTVTKDVTKVSSNSTNGKYLLFINSVYNDY